MNNFFLLLKKTYTHLEDKFQKSFFASKALRRLLTNSKELSYWNKRKDTVFFQKHTRFCNTDQDYTKKNLPSILLPHAAILNISLLINTLAKNYLTLGILIYDKINYKDIIINTRDISYKKEKFDNVIFCEGASALKNPWFSQLPFNLAKGEILSLKIKGKHKLPDEIINCGKWLLPIGNNIFKAGATYSWDQLDTQPTKEARLEILKNLNEHLSVQFDVIDHVAAIRPTTLDYKPFLGAHALHPNLFIFNGLGSKGALMAPYLASHLADVLEGREKIWSEVDIKRTTL